MEIATGATVTIRGERGSRTIEDEWIVTATIRGGLALRRVRDRLSARLCGGSLTRLNGTNFVMMRTDCEVVS